MNFTNHKIQARQLGSAISDIRFLHAIDPIVNVMKIISSNPLLGSDILVATKALLQNEPKKPKNKIENPSQPKKAAKARKATQKKK